MVKRRKKPKKDKETKPENGKNIAGRPSLQDQTWLSDEMERIAQLTYQGFGPDEIAEQLQQPYEKILMLLTESETMKARMQKLFGNRRQIWTKKRYDLYEALMDNVTRRLRNEKESVPWSTVYDLLTDFNGQLGMDEVDFSQGTQGKGDAVSKKKDGESKEDTKGLFKVRDTEGEEEE